MADQPGWPERLLVGGPLVLLALFFLYNVGLRVLLAYGVNTPLIDGLAVLPLSPLEDPTPWRWMLVVLGTLPLLWVGGRTLLRWSNRHNSWWAMVWAIGIVFHTFGPLFTLLELGQGYGYFEYLWLVPTHVEAALVSGGLVVVGGLASLWNWTPKQSNPSSGSATRTEDDGASTATEGSAPSADRRSLLTTGVSVGVGVTLLFNVVYFWAAPWDYSQQTTPAAAFDFKYHSDGRVMVTHTGGDTFTEENTVSMTIRYTDASGTQRIETWAGDGNEFSIGANDTYTTSKPVEPGTTVRVVWTDPGDKTHTVGSFKLDV